MDFVTLATEHQRVLRMLDQMLDDSDDPQQASYSGAPPIGETVVGSTYGAISDSAAATIARPLFSKNAEAELYLLACNFLLYVALVIVVILVCRIYFPEALESNVTASQRPRNYKYRVAEEQTIDEDESYGSEDEDERGEDVLDSSDDEKTNFLDFQQESLSRKQVLQRLIFCCIMLNLTFVLWGVLQVQ